MKSITPLHNVAEVNFFRHLGEVTDTDLFVYCPCTSPFIKPETVSQCINQFISTSDYDCLATVSSVKEFLWLDGDPMNYDPAHAPNSQDLPDVVALEFWCNSSQERRSYQKLNIIGKNPQFVKTSDIESIDIDTPLDFYIAEQLYKKLVIEKKRLLE